MGFVFFSLAISTAFLACSWGLLVYGRALGARHLSERGSNAMAGLDAVEGVVFALLGLMLAFSVSGALQRFDERRQFVVQETNALNTAYDRLGLLGPTTAPELKAKLRSYVEARIALYDQPIGFDFLQGRELYSESYEARTLALKTELMADVVAACLPEGYRAACSIVVPSLNSAFEIAQQRKAATEKHPPVAVFAMLFSLGLAGSLLAGFGMAAGGQQSRIHMAAFAFALTLALYVVTDMEFPRLGFIRMDAFDHYLRDAYTQMR